MKMEEQKKISFFDISFDVILQKIIPELPSKFAKVLFEEERLLSFAKKNYPKVLFQLVKTTKNNICSLHDLRLLLKDERPIICIQMMSENPGYGTSKDLEILLLHLKPTTSQNVFEGILNNFVRTNRYEMIKVFLKYISQLDNINLFKPFVNPLYSAIYYNRPKIVTLFLKCPQTNDLYLNKYIRKAFISEAWDSLEVLLQDRNVDCNKISNDDRDKIINTKNNHPGLVLLLKNGCKWLLERKYVACSVKEKENYDLLESIIEDSLTGKYPLLKIDLLESIIC